MILYGSVARGAGSRLWKEAFFTLQLVPSSIPGADGFSLTTSGGYLSSKQLQKAKLVSVTFLLPVPKVGPAVRDSLNGCGTPALLHAPLWALLGDLGTARVRARKSAFPNKPTPSTTEAQVRVEVILQTSCWAQPSPPQSPGTKLQSISLHSESHVSYSDKWLWNSHEPWATLGQQVFLHNRWGRPWIERGQPSAKWKNFQNPVTYKFKHWCHFQGVPKWTLQALVLPCNLLSKELQRPLHPLEERCSVWSHPRDTQLPGRGDAMGMEEIESQLF